MSLSLVNHAEKLTMNMLSKQAWLACGHISVAMLVTSGLLLGGCGGRDSANALAQTTASEAAAATLSDAAGGSPDGLDRCKLLKDEEISASIGAHQPGMNSIENEWGLQSCRWIATTVQPLQGNPDGWVDRIEIAVFFTGLESWAREQAKGGAAQGFTPGARYDASDGSLWFDCAKRYCVVKAATASPQQREHIARQLAQLVATRMR
jgi:hypothetical protein